MSRHLGHIIEARFPSVAALLVPNWKRIFLGGIDALRPSHDLKEFSRSIEAFGKTADWASIRQGFVPFAGILDRAAKSGRARKRVLRWFKSQPAALLNVNATPSLAYLRLVEAKLPRAALGLTPVSADSTRAAVVQRHLRDACEAEGEARWSLIKTLAPDALTRYEQTVECLVRAESTRRATPILQEKKRTFGKLVSALVAHRPPILSCMLDPQAHKIRNAFSHGAARYDAETGRVDLRDEHWAWRGSVDELLEKFEAMNRLSNQFENATMALFAEHLIDLMVAEVGLLLSGDVRGLEQRLTQSIANEVKRIRERLSATAGCPFTG